MSVFSLDTSTKLAQAACDRRKDISSVFPCPYLLHLTLTLSPQIHRALVSLTSWSFPCLWRFGGSQKRSQKRKEVWDLSEIKPVWNWARDAPQEDLLFHRDHSPVSSAQGHPFHLCRDTVALLETGYWCFLSFRYYLLFYRSFLCSKQMRCTQNTIFKCLAPGTRIFKV